MPSLNECIEEAIREVEDDQGPFEECGYEADIAESVLLAGCTDHDHTEDEREHAALCYGISHRMGYPEEEL